MATQPGIDHLFVVASQSVHRIQEVQTTLYHCLWELTVQALTTSSNRPAADRRAGVTDAD
jgi:D-sedoheptulose 7-phosphate isomerase